MDANLHPPGTSVRVLYRSDWSDELLAKAESEERLLVTHHDDGRATIRVDLAPAGMAIFV